MTYDVFCIVLYIITEADFRHAISTADITEVILHRTVCTHTLVEQITEILVLGLQIL